MLRKPGSCGRPRRASSSPSSTTRAAPCATGEPGELLRAPLSPACSTSTTRTPRPRGRRARGDWLSVGDVAYLDDEGFVYICDRKRDMIISGGVNIYPAEIEDALHRHPADRGRRRLRRARRRVGRARPRGGRSSRPGETLTADEVLTFCRAHLADYKIPREVSFHAAFPRDTAGKLLKRVLREPYWAGRASRV